jgi:hypothetical protein
MTDQELYDDLSRLLREGLVSIELDAVDPDAPARFRPTARGLAYATTGDGAALPLPEVRSLHSGAGDAGAAAGRGLA